MLYICTNPLKRQNKLLSIVKTQMTDVGFYLEFTHTKNPKHNQHVVGSQKHLVR